MDYIRNLKETKFGAEGEVYFGLFDEYIGLMIERGSNSQFAEDCARLLNTLDDSIVSHLCRASILYCNDFRDQVGLDPIDFKQERSVLEQIYPCTLNVPIAENENTPVISMELNCQWEEEHGMEWTVRDNQVLYVGGFNSRNPYGEFSTEEGWNYAWQTNG